MGRGAFDFETWDWTNPLCVGLMWNDGECADFYSDGPFYDWDKEATRVGKEDLQASRWNPEEVPRKALQLMLQAAKADDCWEWYAHNGGKFDALFLFAAARQLGWDITAVMAAGRAIRLSLKAPGEKKSLQICDSYALAPSALAKLAEDFELPSRKLFTKEDYSKDPRTWGAEKLKAGCMVDCKLVLELLNKLETLITDWGGEMKLTFSGSALSVVKADLESKGMKIPSHKKLNLNHLNESSRKAYMGARVEVLHHAPRETLTEWDVASSYPWAMTQWMPWHPLGHANAAGLDRLLTGDYEGPVYARVSVPEMEFPPLPFRVNGKGALLFPVGSWVGWFPAVELRYAMDLGVEVQPLDGILYEKAKPFGDFVNRVYALKQTAKGAVRNFAKLTLNGCYGRFGMKPERQSLRCFADEWDAREYIMEHPDQCEPMGEDPRVLILSHVLWSETTHFAVAGYITALARMKLHAAMVAARGLAYVDSDSIHSRSLALPREDFGEGLGQWKVELDNYTARFYAPKIYELHPREGKPHYASKGFPVSEESFKKLVTGQAVEVERMRLMKTQARIAPETVARTKDAKVWRGESMKRAIKGADGSTRPWKVSELLQGKHLGQRSPIA